MRPPRPPGFAGLVREHQGPLRSFLRRICWRPEDADDVAQETFITAWQQFGEFRGDASFRSWLFGIGYRKALASGRSRSRQAVREAKVAEMAIDTDMTSAELRLDLQNALGVLSEIQRAAVALCWGSGFSHDEAAKTLNLPLGTVKSHLNRARHTLRAELEQSNGSR